MKQAVWFLMLIVLVSCADNGAAVQQKTDSLGRELDTLGGKIEEKAEELGDSVTSKFNDLKEAVNNRMDSIKRARKDSTH